MIRWSLKIICKIKFYVQVEKRPQETPRKVGVTMHPRPQRQGHKGGKKIFCCCGRRPISPEDEDRIAHYFRKMDPNNTGFVTWKQFKKVRNITIQKFAK